MNRRDFLKKSAAVAAIAGCMGATATAAESLTSTQRVYKNPLPRWRGFNLMTFFSARPGMTYKDMVMDEDQLKWMRDWGFDFVRFPISYWLLIHSQWRQTGRVTAEEVNQLDEHAFEMLDQAVDTCNRYGLHINVNLHRAPGYCVNGADLEPYNLWKDKEAEDAFANFWTVLSQRYRNYSNEQVSFNLVNESPYLGEIMDEDDFRRVMKRGIDAIRAVTPDRLIVSDGLSYGRVISTKLIQEGVAQSVHAYDPFRLTHYKAPWVEGADKYAKPQWPYVYEDGVIDGLQALELYFSQWGELVRQGIGVHCGEFGFYKHTPHAVGLAWMTEVMRILKGYDIGYSLWNFAGDFGILDSHRKDVDYEDWYGHKLDRRMLTLLQNS